MGLQYRDENKEFYIKFEKNSKHWRRAVIKGQTKWCYSNTGWVKFYSIRRLDFDKIGVFNFVDKERGSVNYNVRGRATDEEIIPTDEDEEIIRQR